MTQSETEIDNKIVEESDMKPRENDISMLQLQYNCKHYTVFDAIICIESLRR